MLSVRFRREQIVGTPADLAFFAELPEHDRRVLALLGTCHTDTPLEGFYETDCASAVLATAFLLHRHNPLSTSEALQPLVAALRRFVRSQYAAIPDCARQFLDAQHVDKYAPVWTTLISSLRALAESKKLSRDALLPTCLDLIEVFTGERGEYFDNILMQLRDLRGYLTLHDQEDAANARRLSTGRSGIVEIQDKNEESAKMPLNTGSGSAESEDKPKDGVRSVRSLVLQLPELGNEGRASPSYLPQDM